MALNVWTQASGYSLGTFQESTLVTPAIQLPVNGTTGVAYNIISGQLPGGLRLVDSAITGSPYEVSRTTEFKFCVRASKNGEISDRTFKITIEGADVPSFITPSGSLPVGNAQQYFALDNSYVNYQLEVIDPDTAAGQTLNYFIAAGDGELPPGLQLTEDGRIVGFTRPIYSLQPTDGDGTFDSGYFDSVAFDFAIVSSNGYDTYIYDTVFYDFNVPTNQPKKINRNYEFTVTVTDGDSFVKRTFKIFVVADDYFRADNTASWLDNNGLFTADVTYLRTPIWLTPANLGIVRANNYVFIRLDVYDVPDSPVVFTIDNVNNLPPGLNFDLATADLYGVIPYQPAITKTYTFTVTGTRYGEDGETASASRTFTIQIVGEVESTIYWNTSSNLGGINANFVSTLFIKATTSIPNAELIYTKISGKLPPGLELSQDGEIIGKVTQYGDYHLVGSTVVVDRLGLTSFNYDQTKNPTSSGKPTTFDGGKTTVDRVYKFTAQAKDQYGFSAVTREFVITVDTPNQLVFSNIITKPFLKLDQRTLWKDFINNPNIFTPSSIYRSGDPNFGVQEDMGLLVYAGIESTNAGAYVSAMGLNHKRKRFHFGEIKSAAAVMPGTTEILYEVIYVEMLDPLEVGDKKLPLAVKRSKRTDKITVDNDNSYWLGGFPYNKPTPTAGQQAKIDRLAIPAPTNVRREELLTIDSTGVLTSDPNSVKYYPSSISNWQERLKQARNSNGQLLAVERNYLPLWMRSIQPGTRDELGFKLAVPICFCKAGTASDIILKIKYSGFDFKNIDFTVDRYIIDSTDGYTSDKYLVFKNDRITI